ncbi:hypothetical protein PQX77_001554 [Marasmius sp. AFHP31]|nr:hypothetical protein PQX77_001554 [Marasmius sp. AFHP31]
MLIISQWTGCLTLVSDYLSEYDVRHVKYQGDMTRVKREQAVRCGGVGLNLTRGNNVISLNVGWSQAIESQAFDRVHRLVIGNTVEDRIMALQERKVGRPTSDEVLRLMVASSKIMRMEVWVKGTARRSEVRRFGSDLATFNDNVAPRTYQFASLIHALQSIGFVAPCMATHLFFHPSPTPLAAPYIASARFY